MIESTRKKIRRAYTPLTVLASVECTTPSSPLTQVYDSLGADGTEYSPDRSLFPTVVLPKICASAPDGTWPDGIANARLANVKWLANGVDIALDSAWAGLYSVHTADDAQKGMLEIFRNIGVTEVVQLVMEAELVDFRTMRAIKVSTDPVTLSTTARTDDMYALDISEGRVLYYDPVEDRLALDDYNRAHDLKSLSASERAAVSEELTSYLREVPLRLMRGAKELTAAPDIHYRVYRVAADGSLTELGGTFDEILEIPAVGGNIKIDMRLVEDACYLIRAVHGAGASEREIARAQFHAKRIEPDMVLETHNQASMAGTDRKRVDVATAKCGEQIVQQPDRLMRIKWYTETASGTRVSHNGGSVGHISLKRAGVVAADNSGITEDLQMWCEAELRPAYAFAKANGRYLKIGGRPVIMN
ncbi:MAG: hypothetical protein K2N25_01360 [Muribaculaceae bacterium]|nr:hypothetical protein [Muribaculaceae bacterium]